MTDVIVIGGGISGCSTAYALAKRKLRVTLVERNADIALAASGNPVGMLYPKLSANFTAMCQLGIEGFVFTLDLLKLLGKDAPFYAQCGQLQLAYNSSTQAQHIKIAKQPYFQSLPFKARFVNSAQASHIAGIPLSDGGLYLPEAGWLRPRIFCQKLSDSPFIQVRTHTQILNIEPSDDGWRVVGENFNLAAKYLVLCNAYDVTEFIPALQPFVRPVRGQINFFPTDNQSRDLKTVVCADHFIAPEVDGLHSIGTTFGNFDTEPLCTLLDTEQNLSGIAAFAPAIVKRLEAEKLTGRVGWRSTTQDYFPLAGPVINDAALRQSPPRPNAKPDSLPWLKGLYMNAGHGAKGMITAPLSGEWVARLICNEAFNTELANKLQPNRFVMRQLGLKQLAQTIYR